MIRSSIVVWKGSLSNQQAETDISHMDLLVTITGKVSSIVGTAAGVVKVDFAITSPL